MRPRYPRLRRIIAGAGLLLLSLAIGCSNEFESTPTPATTVNTLSAKSRVMNVEQVDTLTLELTDSLTGRAIDSVEVTWSSSDAAIAELAPLPDAGPQRRVEVHARSRGRAVVTATITEPALDITQVQDTILVREQWTSVTTGGAHSCAIAHDGTPFCWGAAGMRQFTGFGIGDGSQGSSVPSQVETGLPFPFVDLSAGWLHTCGSTAVAGLVFCWGSNGRGQLGTGSQFAEIVPEQITGAITASQVAAGHLGTCVIRTATDTQADNLRCWGDLFVVGDTAGAGKVGDCCYTTPFHIDPSLPAAGLEWADVTVGARHSCGTLRDGSLQCWGTNGAGQLGYGTQEVVLFPGMQGDLLSPVTSASAGGNHTCAVAPPDSTAYCWGDNGTRQVGNGSSDTIVTRPASTGLSHVMVISTAGSNVEGNVEHPTFGHTCAVTSDRAVYCWGDNRFGQSGAPPGETLVPTPRAVDVRDSSGVAVPIVAVSTAAFDRSVVGVADISAHSCGLAEDGAIYCWGGNQFGQLGRNHMLTDASTAVPARIAEPD